MTAWGWLNDVSAWKVAQRFDPLRTIQTPVLSLKWGRGQATAVVIGSVGCRMCVCVWCMCAASDNSRVLADGISKVAFGHTPLRTYGMSVLLSDPRDFTGDGFRFTSSPGGQVAANAGDGVLFSSGAFLRTAQRCSCRPCRGCGSVIACVRCSAWMSTVRLGLAQDRIPVHFSPL